MGGELPGLVGGNLYAHLGIASRVLDASTVETTLPARDSLLGAGVRAASLGLAMEHGMPLLARVAALPVVISVHTRETPAGIDEIRVATRIDRIGRTLMVTESTFSEDHGRTIGFGTITWSVSSAPPEAQTPDLPLSPAGSSRDSGEGPRGSGLLDVLGVVPLPDGDGCRLAAMSPDIAGPGGVLHAGVIQVLCEEAALRVGRRVLSTGDFTSRDCVFHLLAAGRAGPFVATGRLMASRPGEADCRVELRDEGRDASLIALADVRSAGS